MARYVTLFSCIDPSMGALARTKLEWHGIPCFLANEHLTGIQWLWSNALGGVAVAVPEEYATLALELLTEDFLPIEDPADFAQEHADKPLPEPEDPASPPPSAADFSPEMVCPECASDQLQSVNLRRSLTLFINHLFGIPLPFSVSRRYTCLSCGHKWKNGE